VLVGERGQFLRQHESGRLERENLSRRAGSNHSGGLKMAESISAASGEGFGIVVLAAAAAVILVYPFLQMILKMFGITV
jgi:hypothetical protein